MICHPFDNAISWHHSFLHSLTSMRSTPTSPITVSGNLELCALTAPIALTVTRTGSLSVTKDFMVVDAPTLNVSGTLDVLGQVSLGDPYQLPPVPAR
jgi:hypothetical protein